MIEERKMNILLCRKVGPYAQAPKRNVAHIPMAKARGFTRRSDKPHLKLASMDNEDDTPRRTVFVVILHFFAGFFIPIL